MQTRPVPFSTGFPLLLCLSLLTASASAQPWTQIAPPPTPEARDGAVLVHDPVRKQLVLFGGRALDDSDETWTLEGDVWTRRSPAHSPAARANAYGYWDSARSKVVVFGGNGAGQIDRATFWSWDGSDWSSSTPAASPPPRRDAAVTYDSARDRVVLFGGVVDGSPDVSLADTWEFDGSRWIETTPALSAGDRGGAMMGYDPVQKRVVMVNGYSEAQRSLRWDTWTYDGSSWKELPSANTPRGGSLRMVWDAAQQKLLIAGRHETGKLTAWYFDGAVWSEQPGATFNLNGAAEPSVAFDADAGYVLYLREEGQSYRGFRLRNGSWDQLLPVVQPGPAGAGRGVLFYDAEAGEMRLLAERSPGDGLQGFRWDGVMWRPVELAGSARPSGMASVAYDAERGVAVAYDARTYELAGDSWSPRASAKLPHTGGALAYDVSRAGSVYFGGVIAFGEYSDQTWLWDGAAWEPLAALTSPPARTRAAMAYDERRETLVLFGGATIVQGRQSHAFDTWELRDTTWSEVTASGPTPRDTPSMTYDQGRRRVVLWAAQSERDSRLWEFDGKRWLGEEPPPIAGAAGVVGYDTREQRLLLHDNAGRTWARASGAAPGDETPTPPEHEPDEPAPADTDAGTGDDQDGGASTGTGGRRGSDGGCVLVVAEPARGSLWSLVGALSVLGWRRRRARIAQLHR